MKPAIPLFPARLLAVAALLGAAACTDDPAPSATIRSVSPDQLTPSDDASNDVTIGIGYADSDGDLGGGVAEVHDCRADDVVIALAIPPIASEAHQSITGSLELHVNDVADLVAGPLPPTCAGLGVTALADHSVVFCVVLVDAAGHRGAGACTRPITVAAP